MIVGSLCTGYGGLDLGLKRVFPDAHLEWCAEVDPAASAVIEKRFGVPNLGDIRRIDEWPYAEVLLAGYPCQPFSDAGLKQDDADPRDLIPYVCEAIGQIRPRFAVLENVPGHRRRGFGRVLGFLAEMGFNAQWHSVRASEAGAPHRRERVFILASNTQDYGQQWPWQTRTGGGDLRTVVNAHSQPWNQWRLSASGEETPGRPWADSGRSNGIPWGVYLPAIVRWEALMGRPSPTPTEIGPKGNRRLSPRFVQWMMGLDPGWVTDFNFSRKQTFTLLGNGVVPQQAELAIRSLIE